MEIIKTYLTGSLWEFNELRCLKHRVHCLAHNKCSVNISSLPDATTNDCNDEQLNVELWTLTLPVDLLRSCSDRWGLITWIVMVRICVCIYTCAHANPSILLLLCSWQKHEILYFLFHARDNKDSALYLQCFYIPNKNQKFIRNRALTTTIPVPQALYQSSPMR